MSMMHCHMLRPSMWHHAKGQGTEEVCCTCSQHQSLAKANLGSHCVMATSRMTGHDQKPVPNDGVTMVRSWVASKHQESIDFQWVLFGICCPFRSPTSGRIWRAKGLIFSRPHRGKHHGQSKSLREHLRMCSCSSQLDQTLGKKQ